jgi:aldose 1-epimerase
MKKSIFLILIALIFILACNQVNNDEKHVEKRYVPIAELTDSVFVYTLTGDSGFEVQLTNYGCYVTSIKTPNRDNKVEQVVLGYDSVYEYLKDEAYFGPVVGRYANRIDSGKFELNGQIYQLTQNEDENQLHGGHKGFNRKVWKEETIKNHPDSQVVVLKYVSKHGEEGFPGNLTAHVRFVVQGMTLKTIYTAQTDSPTVVNMTHHFYLNLKDAGKSKILDHKLMINAGQYTQVDNRLIPTGKLLPVEATYLDFSESKPVGQDLKDSLFYDHNFILNKPKGKLGLAAKLYSPASGRSLKVLTNQPGIQFYAGHFLDGVEGKNGMTYQKHAGMCLEPQKYPDSPNQPGFPSTVLNPGEKYYHISVYEFSVK